MHSNSSLSNQTYEDRDIKELDESWNKKVNHFEGMKNSKFINKDLKIKSKFIELTYCFIRLSE
jgi:hypothetical protein